MRTSQEGATPDDPFDLRRFVDIQGPHIGQALEELRAGAKRTHWMWFIFPQLAGLGHSPMAQLYAISGLDEARAYLAHPVLGPRLVACTEAVLGLEGGSLRAIFGSPDDLKFRSSMTLFAAAAGRPDSVFRRALERHGGNPDPATMAMLRS